MEQALGRQVLEHAFTSIDLRIGGPIHRPGPAVSQGPRRDADIIHIVRVKCEQEAALFQRVGRTSPVDRRKALSDQFGDADGLAVPDRRGSQWRAWCTSKKRAALEGSSVAPFDKEASPANEELLKLLPKVLAWQGESLIRFVSCVLCGNSKQ